jgi:hypothetical protein
MGNIKSGAMATAIPDTKTNSKASSMPDLIRAEVIFGSPQLGCRGTGICKIAHSLATYPFSQKTDCRKALAYVGLSADGRCVQLMLHRSSVCIQIYKNHLRHGVLEMGQAVRIPAVLQRMLGASLNMLPAGRHEVRQTADGFLISIPLS